MNIEKLMYNMQGLRRLNDNLNTLITFMKVRQGDFTYQDLKDLLLPLLLTRMEPANFARLLGWFES